MKHFYLFLAFSLLLLSPSLAQEWQVYDASVIPADADFSTNGGSANATVSVVDDPTIPGNKLLRFISPDEGSQYSFTQNLTPTVNDLTLAMRVRGLPDVDTLVRLFDLDVRFGAVNLREKFIIDYDNDVKFERSGVSGVVDNATDWHIWRFVCNGSSNEWSVYVDEMGPPVLESSSPDGTTNQYFKMGDGSGGNSMGALIDWVVWDTTGAFTPEQSALPTMTGTEEDLPQVAFLTHLDWVYYDTYGYYADSLFVADLEEQGYEVTLLDYSTYASVTPEEANALKAADLVILGRGISSGDFDDPDDVIWSDLKTPIILMSNYVARANRLGYFGSNDLQDFARLDTFYAEVVNPADPAFAGLTVPGDGIIPYAEDNLGPVLADETMLNGDVILALEGVGTAYRIDNGNGSVTDTFDLADYDANVLMARWSPGDSMYLSSPSLPGYISSIAGGYRSYIAVGHDREFDTDLSTRIRDYYVFTDFSRQVWLNEVANLIELSSAGNADLQSVEVDGVPISFDPDSTDIAFAFLAGTDPAHQPIISATPKAADATLVISQPTDANGTATITVTANDGSTMKTYNLDLSVGAGEGVIIYVTNTEWVEFDTYGAYADSFFVADLQQAGYDVYVTPYSNYGTIDPVEATALEMADLVVLGRGISSGDFDDADDGVWAELETPVVLMSSFVARANRLGWLRSNSTQDFARLDTYSAEASRSTDPIFAGVGVPLDGIFSYAEDNLGVILADETQMNGEVLVSLEGVGTAFRIDNGNGSVTDTFDLADFHGNVLMARWSPGDSMYTASLDLPGFTSVVPGGYRTYVTVGHDREYDTDLSTRIRDYYSLTPAGNTLWLNEVNHLINLSEENPADSKYALLSDLSVDGTAIPDFDPLDFEYTLEVVDGEDPPTLVGVPAYANASVSVIYPASLPDTAFVQVVSEDGITVLEYAVLIDVIVGTNHPKLAGISIYPNPVSDRLLIEMPVDLEECRLDVLTPLGQSVYTEMLQGTRNDVFMGALPAGMYFIRLEADGRQYTQRILKQ